MEPDLFTCHELDITEAQVRSFVLNAIASRLQAESLVVEFKLRANDKNIVKAVAAMSNTDGGLVFVGVNEDEPSSPFTGVTTSEVDGIVQQLRAHLPGAIPSVVPVALSDAPGRALVVLRVDTDLVDRPVVLEGRVLVRVPGASVGARRDEVIALTQVGQKAPTTAGFIPMDVGRTTMWSDEPPAHEVRVLARLRLPRHCAQDTWLGTKATMDAVAALQLGPIPGLIRSEHLRPREITLPRWRVSESRALRATFDCEPSPPGHHGRASFAGRVKVSLNGRTLETLVSIIPTKPDTEKLDVESFADMLLSAAYTSGKAGQAIAGSIGCSRPLGAPWLDAWIYGPLGPDGVYLPRHWGLAEHQLSEYRFQQLRPVDTQPESLLEVVRRWMTPLLLDMGATGFEAYVDALTAPAWVGRVEGTSEG